MQQKTAGLDYHHWHQSVPWLIWKSPKINLQCVKASHHNSWCCKVTRSTPYALAWMPRHFVPVNTITAVAHNMRTVCAA